MRGVNILHIKIFTLVFNATECFKQSDSDMIRKSEGMWDSAK